MVMEGPDRMRVYGCGKSELFVRRCASRSSPGPVSESRPVTEVEARAPSPAAGPTPTGCAWSRATDAPADWRPSE